MRKDLNLDIEAPDEVSYVLRRASEAYYESASEVESAWQEPGAGRPWEIIARILDKTAEQIDKRLKPRGPRV